MADKLLLEPSNYYHIYNRGNNGQNIFFEKKNYEFFLHRMDQYLSPFCDILAWVLLESHFHLLVFVKEVVDTEKLVYTATEVPKKVEVHLQFGHFFNSYAKAINYLRKILKENRSIRRTTSGKPFTIFTIIL